MDVVIRLGVRIEMHWPLFSIGTLQLNSSPVSYYLKYPPLDTQYHIVDGNTTYIYILEKLKSINDLGVIFDSNLTFKDHMAQK